MPKLQCNQCGEWKKESGFSPDKRQKTGYHSRCKLCQNETQRESRKKRREQRVCIDCGGGGVTTKCRCGSCAERRRRYTASARSRAKEDKRCLSCGSLTEGVYILCQSCGREKNEAGKIWRQQLKEEVFGAYGGAACACCGEKRMEFLSIDHIANDGAQHRKKIGGLTTGAGIHRWLKKNKYPSGFQVLCFNCNMSKGFHGYCPHEWDKLYPMIYAEQDIDLTQWKEAVGL